MKRLTDKIDWADTVSTLYANSTKKRLEILKTIKIKEQQLHNLKQKLKDIK